MLDMIIVAGCLEVVPGTRDAYLAGCREVVVSARRTPGCRDFQISADPVDPGRINVYEQWDSVAAVEAFRGTGPTDEQAETILSAEVWQYEVASAVRL